MAIVWVHVRLFCQLMLICDITIEGSCDNAAFGGSNISPQNNLTFGITMKFSSHVVVSM
jgi:hypothetical protein